MGDLGSGRLERDALPCLVGEGRLLVPFLFGLAIRLRENGFADRLQVGNGGCRHQGGQAGSVLRNKREAASIFPVKIASRYRVPIVIVRQGFVEIALLIEVLNEAGGFGYQAERRAKIPIPDDANNYLLLSSY